VRSPHALATISGCRWRIRRVTASSVGTSPGSAPWTEISDSPVCHRVRCSTTAGASSRGHGTAATASTGSRGPSGPSRRAGSARPSGAATTRSVISRAGEPMRGLRRSRRGGRRLLSGTRPGFLARPGGVNADPPGPSSGTCAAVPTQMCGETPARCGP
jgi:hypothetical protein